MVDQADPFAPDPPLIFKQRREFLVAKLVARTGSRTTPWGALMDEDPDPSSDAHM